VVIEVFMSTNFSTVDNHENGCNIVLNRCIGEKSIDIAFVDDGEKPLFKASINFADLCDAIERLKDSK